MSIKTSAEEWVRKGPSQALALAAVAGIVVGGVIGLGAGYKVEQNRTRSDVKKLHAQINALGGSTGATGASGASTKFGDRVGKVTAVGTSSFTVTTKQKGSQVLQTSSTTLFEQVSTGTIGDVQKGKHVLVATGGREIIVLPTTSKLGRAVTNVAGDAITIQKTSGSGTVKVLTKNVKTVDTVKTAAAGDVKVGSDVFAGGKQATGNNFTTVELVLLPAGSSFGV